MLLTRRSHALTAKDTILLTDFRNSTGDPSFDDALKQALTMNLEQSPFLNILSATKSSETLRLMNQSSSASLTPDLARDLCLRSGSKAFLSGSISNVGSHYLVAIDATGCTSGESLAKAQFQAASKDDVLPALSRAASNLRTKLGESLPSVQKFDVPIQVTTSSLEALKYYGMSGKIASEQGDAAGIPFLKRSIELDPNFDLAYSSIAYRYIYLEERSDSLVAASKSYDLLDLVT